MADLSFDDGLRVLSRRAKWARVAIYAVSIAWGLVVLCDLARFGGILDLDSPGPLLLPAVVVYFASALAYVVSAVLIAMWIYRAHANLFAAGLDGLEYSPGWSVGSFFVPLANLFVPFKAMRELWSASHNADDSFGREAPPELTAWWGAFIVANIVVNLSSRYDQPTALDGAQSFGALVSAIGAALMIASALFLLRIVNQVTEAQRSVTGPVDVFA